jgi:hypothetical protein
MNKRKGGSFATLTMEWVSQYWAKVMLVEVNPCMFIEQMKLFIFRYLFGTCTYFYLALKEFDKVF